MTACFHRLPYFDLFLEHYETDKTEAAMDSEEEVRMFS